MTDKSTKGLVIVIDGVDGSGKSSQVNELVKMHEKKYGTGSAVSNQEPTMDSDFGLHIRKILEHKVPAPSPEVMQYLYYADRLLNWQNNVLPQVAQGVTVYKDRDRTVTCAYGMAGGVPVEKILEWHESLPDPDLYIYLRVSPEEAIKRIKERFSKEGKHLEFFEKEESIRKNIEAFDKLSTLNLLPNFVTVDGEGGFEEISANLWQEVTKCLNKTRV